MVMVGSVKTDIKVVRKLLRSGAEINAQNRFGWTALMFAASAGRKTAIDELLEYGADSSSRSNLQKTALDLAEESAYQEAGVLERLRKDAAQ